jgi:ATP-dependent helicase/nuclease subunit A
LSETHYREWLRGQPGGEQRYANVQRLLTLAQQFDQFQRQGLFRFLRFVEAQRNADSEPDVAPVAEENAVRLMSIHQSKGLEFPVVMVADLGKPFNVSDLRADLILDDKYGLCPQIMPPDSGSRYPSLPHWLASRRQHRELLGEELRLLYVAMTRARDTLLLSATVSEKRFEKAIGWPFGFPKIVPRVRKLSKAKTGSCAG